MRRMPAEVAINVEQHVESAQAEDVDFRKLRRAGHRGGDSFGAAEHAHTRSDGDVKVPVDLAEEEEEEDVAFHAK